MKNIETGIPIVMNILQKRGLLWATPSMKPLNLLVLRIKMGPSTSILSCFLNRRANTHMTMNPIA
jgi:hypothetical protein